MFSSLCPRLRFFVESSFSPYRHEVTRSAVSRNLLNLMLLTSVKSLNQDYNEEYTLQKIIALIGGGRTGKSQLGSLFTLLSLNNTQSCEMKHLHSRFESVAWHNRSLLTFPDISARDLKGNRWMDGLSMLKKLSGQDWIRGEGKYLKNLSFRYVGLVVLMSNHKIPIDDSDFQSQFDRHHPIYFTNRVTSAVSDLTRNVLSTELLGVLALVMCLVEDNAIGHIVEDIGNFSLTETLVANGESSAITTQTDLLMGFAYDRLERVPEGTRPMLMQHLLLALVWYHKKRPDSRMMVKDIDAFENLVRGALVSKNASS